MGALAIFFAIISLGLGGYLLYDNVFTDGENTMHQWYKENDGYSFMGGSDQYIDPMSFNVEITEESTLYVLFIGFIEFPANSFNLIYLNVRVDNSEVGQEMIVEAENIDYRQRFSLSLQYYDPSLPAGAYNVSIWARVFSDNASFGDMTLYVQTFS